MTQLSIYDQKQRGIEVSYANTSTEWKEEAGAALQILAKLQRYITSEDIIILLEKKGLVTGNNRSLGAVMQAAQRSGLIKPTGQWKTSQLKRRHGAPLRIWEVVR